MNNDENILKILEKHGKILEDLQTGQETLQEDFSDIKAVQQGHGEKLDRIEDPALHTKTTVEILEDKIDETKLEVDEIKKRQRPRHAD